MSAVITDSQGFEDSGFSAMDLVYGPDGARITQAGISTIEYSVYAKANVAGSSYGVSATGTLTVSAVVFDTLQADARWSRDSIGYNFRWDVPASLVPDGGKTYLFEIKFTPASGQPFHVLHRHATVELQRL